MTILRFIVVVLAFEYAQPDILPLGGVLGGLNSGSLLGGGGVGGGNILNEVPLGGILGGGDGGGGQALGGIGNILGGIGGSGGLGGVGGAASILNGLGGVTSIVQKLSSTVTSLSSVSSEITQLTGTLSTLSRTATTFTTTVTKLTNSLNGAFGSVTSVAGQAASELGVPATFFNDAISKVHLATRNLVQLSTNAVTETVVTTSITAVSTSIQELIKLSSTSINSSTSSATQAIAIAKVVVYLQTVLHVTHSTVTSITTLTKTSTTTLTALTTAVNRIDGLVNSFQNTAPNVDAVQGVLHDILGHLRGLPGSPLDHSVVPIGGLLNRPDSTTLISPDGPIVSPIDRPDETFNREIHPYYRPDGPYNPVYDGPDFRPDYDHPYHGPDRNPVFWNFPVHHSGGPYDISPIGDYPTLGSPDGNYPYSSPDLDYSDYPNHHNPFNPIDHPQFNDLGQDLNPYPLHQIDHIISPLQNSPTITSATATATAQATSPTISTPETVVITHPSHHVIYHHDHPEFLHLSPEHQIVTVSRPLQPIFRPESPTVTIATSTATASTPNSPIISTPETVFVRHPSRPIIIRDRPIEFHHLESDQPILSLPINTLPLQPTIQTIDSPPVTLVQSTATATETRPNIPIFNTPETVIIHHPHHHFLRPHLHPVFHNLESDRPIEVFHDHILPRHHIIPLPIQNSPTITVATATATAETPNGPISPINPIIPYPHNVIIREPSHPFFNEPYHPEFQNLSPNGPLNNILISPNHQLGPIIEHPIYPSSPLLSPLVPGTTTTTTTATATATTVTTFTPASINLYTRYFTVLQDVFSQIIRLVREITDIDTNQIYLYIQRLFLKTRTLMVYVSQLNERTIRTQDSADIIREGFSEVAILLRQFSLVIHEIYQIPNVPRHVKLQLRDSLSATTAVIAVTFRRVNHLINLINLGGSTFQLRVTIDSILDHLIDDYGKVYPINYHGLLSSSGGLDDFTSKLGEITSGYNPIYHSISHGSLRGFNYALDESRHELRSLSTDFDYVLQRLRELRRHFGGEAIDSLEDYVQRMDYKLNSVRYRVNSMHNILEQTQQYGHYGNFDQFTDTSSAASASASAAASGADSSASASAAASSGDGSSSASASASASSYSKVYDYGSSLASRLFEFSGFPVVT